MFVFKLRNCLHYETVERFLISEVSDFRPVAVGGKVEIRPMMYVALTYDHRLIDGKEAVTFLKKIKSAVEDPRVIFLDL